MRMYVVINAILLNSFQFFAQPFVVDTAATNSLVDVRRSTVDWGDFDNDGDLDILMTGQDANFNKVSIIYRRNADGTYSDINAGLVNVFLGAACWADYNNDGNLDILITGSSDSDIISVIYRNNADGTFTNINAGLKGVSFSAADWGDYDNDGDLDILITGEDFNFNKVTTIYRNDGNDSFTEIDPGIVLVSSSSVDWGDYDNDGDLDILLTGRTNGVGRTSKVYRNDGAGIFSDVAAGLAAVRNGSAKWGDYDGDGDLDIVLTGETSTSRVSLIYRNDGANLFTDIGAGLIGLSSGSVCWGDFDNDGDLDLLLTGEDISMGRHSIIYRNDGNDVFIDTNSGLTNVYESAIAWGDYDNDNDLDILLTGRTNSTNTTTLIYRNLTSIANTLPSMPENLRINFVSDSIYFLWDTATDTETAPDGLTYNLRIATTANGEDIKPPMSFADGARKVVGLGNVNHVTAWPFFMQNLADYQTLYWSVQAVDNAFSGSLFPPEDSIVFAAKILSIKDIPNDQGGKVRISWRKSHLDTSAVPISIQITSYGLWRKIQTSKRQTLTDRNFGMVLNDTLGSLYDFVMNIPAVQSPAYNVVVSTFADSSSAGTNYFTFLVTAHTIDPNIFFISRRDSGYSVDNIPPAPPANLTAQNISGPVELNWDANTEPDLRQYLLYRSTLPNIDPDQIAPFATTNTNNHIDNNPLPGGKSYYIVLAEDIHDNRSLPSNEVEVRTLDQFRKRVIIDWNIVGLPSEVLDNYYLSLFPTAIPRTLFGYNGKYFELDTLGLFQGYWLRFSSPDSFTLEGFPVQSTSINLMQGWNLLSGPSCDVALSDVSDPQGIILQGTLFGFEISYIAADTIKQGTGYWLRANAAGQITLNCGNSQSTALAKSVSTGNRYRFPKELSTFPSISLRDAAGAEQTLYFNVSLNSPQEKLHYSLPPVPPPGKNIFDARFTGDYRVSETMDDEIKLRATNFPLILTPSNFNDNGEEQFTLTEFISGMESVNQPIKNGIQIKISDPRVTSLRLHKTKVILLNFEVSQNFPNPFNPVTEIRYTIPEAGRVKVVVYNSLGQKIKTLLSEMQEAGHHRMRWNGRNETGQQVGSGVYYLSVQSGKYSATRKMILMR